MQEARDLKVLSVVGAGRSGTTVLAEVLGEYEGVAAAGEIRWLWERGLQGGRPCACRKSPTDCEVWSEVASKVLGPLGPERTAAVDRIVAAQHELDHSRAMVRAIRRVGDPDADPWPAWQTVHDATSAACHALASVTQSHVVVDTSKRAVDAAILSSADAIEQYVVHIVRDPRAVVHSWRNAKSFDVDGQTYTMGTKRLPGAVRRWWWSATAAELLHRRVDASRWLHVKYEDFARDPRAVIAQVMDLLGETPDGSPFVDDHTVSMHPNHVVAGNPSRFKEGSVRICVDERWRSAMPRRDQRLIRLSTVPLMRRYGYSS